MERQIVFLGQVNMVKLSSWMLIKTSKGFSFWNLNKFPRVYPEKKFLKITITIVKNVDRAESTTHRIKH